ncbi:MAG: hypothetical protein ACM4D3_18910 [Candidatus Sericytochromatia bacterium]
MSANPNRILASLDIEPTYSAQEAAAFLGRSYSWLDQRLRAGDFVLPDGSPIQPTRTPTGYRRFTLKMLQDIATYCWARGWFSMADLEYTVRELLVAAYLMTGKWQIPE